MAKKGQTIKQNKLTKYRLIFLSDYNSLKKKCEGKKKRGKINY